MDRGGAAARRAGGADRRGPCHCLLVRLRPGPGGDRRVSRGSSFRVQGACRPRRRDCLARARGSGPGQGRRRGSPAGSTPTTSTPGPQAGSAVVPHAGGGQSGIIGRARTALRGTPVGSSTRAGQAEVQVPRLATARKADHWQVELEVPNRFNLKRLRLTEGHLPGLPVDTRLVNHRLSFRARQSRSVGADDRSRCSSLIAATSFLCTNQ